jgi:hypothetical protein
MDMQWHNLHHLFPSGDRPPPQADHSLMPATISWMLFRPNGEPVASRGRSTQVAPGNSAMVCRLDGISFEQKRWWKMRAFPVWLGLTFATAMTVLSYCRTRPDSRLSDEYSQLIDDLREQRFSSLPALHPHPHRILFRGELSPRDQEAYCVLYYDLANGRLIIMLDDHLGLMKYDIIRTD